MKTMLLFLLLVGVNVFAEGYPNNCKVRSMVENTLVGSTTPTLLVARFNERRCMTIVNKGASTVYITFDSTAATTQGIPIPAGGNWDQNNVTVDDVYAHALAGTTTSIVLMEGK